MTVTTEYADCPHCEERTLCGKGGQAYAEKNPDPDAAARRPFLLIDETYLLCTKCGKRFGKTKRIS